MSLVVLMSQVWGYLLKEWRGASRDALTLYGSSLAVIVLAVVVLGIAGGL
jgi:hypothetical protein